MLNDVRIKLQKMEGNYPLFVECWEKFLKMREKSFSNTIEKCDEAIELMKKSDIDLTPETIGLLLILIKQTI